MRKQLFLPAAEKVRVAIRFFANLGYEESLDQAATPASSFLLRSNAVSFSRSHSSCPVTSSAEHPHFPAEAAHLWLAMESTALDCADLLASKSARRSTALRSLLQSISVKGSIGRRKIRVPQ
jgi:hypothetical protein